MAPGRKRRVEREASESSSESPPRRRRIDDNRSTSPSVAADEDADYEGQTQMQGIGSLEIMVKKLVRLALACEYSRVPIRRADISAKVLGETGSRQFKNVFEGAQQELLRTFGMQMVELPMKEKVTISQRRAAQKSDKAAMSSKAWILSSTLGEQYRSNPVILPPTKASSTATESTYTALYTFIISLIALSGGTIAEAKLERHLKRTNADQYTPIDRTEKLLARLCREGYIVKNKDSSSGEEIVEYAIGPRGKVEVGEDGVAGLIRGVYGKVDAEAEELEMRIGRSLGTDSESKRRAKEREIVKDAETAADADRDGGTRGKGRVRRRRDVEDEDD